MASNPTKKIVRPTKETATRPNPARKRISPAALPGPIDSPAGSGDRAPLPKLPFGPDGTLPLRWAQEGQACVFEMRWSPTEHRVALLGGGEVSILALDGDGTTWTQHVARPMCPSPEDLVWSPDGRSLFVAEGSGPYGKPNSHIVKRDANGQELERFPVPNAVKSLDIHPEGKSLAVGLAKTAEKSCNTGEIRIYDAEGSLKRRRVQQKLNVFYLKGVRFDPSGDLLTHGYAHSMQAVDLRGRTLWGSSHASISWLGPREIVSFIYNRKNGSGAYRVSLGDPAEREIERIGDDGGFRCAAVLAREPELVAPWDSYCSVLVVSPDGQFVGLIELNSSALHIFSARERKLVRTIETALEHPRAAFTAAGDIACWGFGGTSATLFESTWQSPA